MTVRGTRHLRDLAKAVTFGSRAVILYCIQRNDVTEVRPADTIDPEYGKTLRKAVDEGVEPLAYRARITLTSIELETAVPVVCPG